MSSVRVAKENLTTAPCTEACPCHIDAARYIRYIRQGRYDKAVAVNREKIPFPAVCGYACFNPCEVKCGYRQFGEPIAIRALKRASVERGGDRWKKNLRIKSDTGKKVAVVGSGPAGMTAAYFLKTKGHQVTVYDSAAKAGGMMRYGIPRYRLPERSLNKDLKMIFDLGVKFQPKTAIGKDISLLELRKEYDAIFLSTGSNLSRRLDLHGVHLSGILWGVDFLHDIAMGKKMMLRGPVVVVGGGNVAVDVALTSKRLGAKEVTLVCLEKREEMPAHEWEIARALEEGVGIQNGLGPKRFVGNRSVKAVEFVKCTSVFDKKGYFCPTYDPDSTLLVGAKTVILAIGQSSDLTFMGEEVRVGTDGDRVLADKETLETGEPGIFAGGEVVTGPASIIESIAQGRKAAVSIDRYLGGDGEIDQQLVSPEKEVVVRETGDETKPRSPMPLAPLKKRINSFSQVELGFKEQAALQEARRCLMCDARQFRVVVHTDACKECGYCTEVCGMDVFVPSSVFNKKGFRPMQAAHPERCVGCYQCFYVCPDFSIDIEDTLKKNIS